MANDREAELDYPLGEALPAPGTTLEVAPGVRWLRMSLPFALDHINLWLLEDEIDGRQGFSLVDCGIASDETRAAWQAVFERELRAHPLLRVICTHMHPDHIGLAHWLTERFGCRLWISATDWNAARMGSRGSTSGVGGEGAARFFATHGLVDADSLDKVRRRSNYYASLVPDVPGAFRRLLDGQALAIGGREWRCIAGYGHAPEHMALYCAEANLLISGDMVLPRISTNVSVIDIEPEADPLTLYLDSLQRFRALPEDCLVLPSHGRPFKGLHRRLGQLAEHHEARFADVLAACAEAPRSAADLLGLLFKRKLDLHQTTFAMGEAIAHLHALWHAGKLARQADADGVLRFRTV